MTRIGELLKRLQVMEGVNTFQQNADAHPDLTSNTTPEDKTAMNIDALKKDAEVEKQTPKAGTWGAANRGIQQQLRNM